MQVQHEDQRLADETDQAFEDQLLAEESDQVLESDQALLKLSNKKLKNTINNSFLFMSCLH